MTTIYMIRAQRGGYLTGAVYATEEAALSDAVALPESVGWTRVVPVPLLASPEDVAAYRAEQAAEAARIASLQANEPMRFEVSITGEVK